MLHKVNKKHAIREVESIRAANASEIAPGENLFQKWLIAAALLVIPALLLVLYYRALFPGLTNDSALDFAQLGRNLSAGRGFTTYFLRPLALTHGGNSLRQPDVTHGPLYPVLLALAFGGMGAKDSVVAGVSGLFYLLTVPLVYWLGAKVFHRNVGLIAALVFAANPLMLEYGTSGLPITLFTFLTTCLLLVVHHIATWVGEPVEGTATAPIPRLQFGLAGFLTGALYLTDPIFVWIVPVILTAVVVLSGAGSRRTQAVLYFLIPLGLLVSPWMVRNGLLTGNPVFGLRGMEVWMGTKDFYPGEIAYRYTPSDLIPGVGLFNAVVRKLLLGVGEVVQSFPQVSASWMLAFLLPSLLFRFKDPATNVLRRVMMYCFAGVLVGMLPLGIEMPLFACLIPTMLVFAIAYLFHLTEEARLPRPSLILLASLLSIAVFLPVLRDMTLTDKPSALPEMTGARALAQITGPGDAVLTDQPWIVAWYSDRPAIWVPAVDKKIKGIRAQFPELRYLFLTEQTRGLSPQWQYLYATFQRWNQVYSEARAGNKPVPEQLTITGETTPLIESLNGFGTVAPLKGTDSTTVIAALPR